MTRRVPILVVDDDDAIRRLVVRVMKREQYDVAEATHGGEALASLRRTPAAVVLLDLMMPVTTGAEVITYLATRDDARAPCVIVMSAASEGELNAIKEPAGNPCPLLRYCFPRRRMARCTLSSSSRIRSTVAISPSSAG